MSILFFFLCLLLLSQIAGTQEQFCCHFVHNIPFNHIDSCRWEKSQLKRMSGQPSPNTLFAKNEMITPQTKTLDKPFSWISVSKWFSVGGGWLFTGLPFSHCPTSFLCTLMPSPCRSTGWTVLLYW